MGKKKFISKKFDSSKKMDAFLEEEDLGYLFASHGEVQIPKIHKVNLDLPEWLVAQLDFEATRAGISRQPVIKLLLIQKLEEERRKRSA
ncbi:MAG: hypothetical protein FJ146_14200 [Deltaproteobacteria bacterium]|nr:hypothetical protein [Deltaproteobacteria bacterium]